jgi:hypothetical protein
LGWGFVASYFPGFKFRTLSSSSSRCWHRVFLCSFAKIVFWKLLFWWACFDFISLSWCLQPSFSCSSISDSL